MSYYRRSICKNCNGTGNDPYVEEELCKGCEGNGYKEIYVITDD